MRDNLDKSLHPWAAVFTWCVVFGLGVLLMRDAGTPYDERMVEFVCLQVGFLIVIIASVWEHGNNGRRLRGYAMLLVAIVLVFILGWRFPISFLPIYSIMWITLLPFYFSTRVSVGILFAVIAGWYSVERFGWDTQDPLMEVLLFGTFHLFALFSSLTARRAEDATQHARELNRGLLATQQLLADAAKENERTRIARDLHDQLGHHMTALAINLQVASRLADGEVKDKVDQCHDLSKQLLGDVRKAVSTLREHKSLDVTGSLQRLVEDVPGLKVHLKVEPELEVTDVSISEAIVRCVQEAVTNTLRHARASEIWIRLWHDGKLLRLEIKDNGRATVKVTPGNGLAGMRERIEKLNGRLTLNGSPSFTIDVELPRAVLS